VQRDAKFKVMKENLEKCNLGSIILSCTKMKGFKLFFSVPIIYIFDYNLRYNTYDYFFIN